MNCLCCAKPLRSSNARQGWHQSCIKKFFGTSTLPEIAIDEEVLQRLAAQSISKGYTVPGVQKKLSLHLLLTAGNPRLTMVNYPTGYILKPQVADFEALPETEHLVMCMADAAGIYTVPHALILGSGKPSYITKRVDRVFAKDHVAKLAMEDFCQLDLRLTQDKYRGSYERCAGIVNRHSCRKGLDMTELYIRIVFSFIVGNSDMHLKNFSLLETAENSGEYQLSPAYDLLAVNVVMPEDNEQLALALNGKKTNLRRKDFLVFADEIGISRPSAQKMIAMLISMKETFTAMCESSLLPEHLKARFSALMEERITVLAK